MSTPVRYDEQYCPIARALDVLGDRWTVPILRELSFGDQRFTDLREHLPGIAPTVLTQRLRTMVDEGLVTTKPSSSPRRSTYALTERGRSTAPILRELARWGMPLLEPAIDGRTIRPAAAAAVAVRNYYDAAAADGISERYLLRIDGEPITLSSVKGGGKARDQRDTADLEIDASADVWIRIRQGRLTLKDARQQGELHVQGPARSLRNFQRIFQVP
jgi:DNA-binding HxlR family transcriptional regulator